MSDLTLAILNDRTKYPDDRKIILADGEEITVKELRDTLQPRSEFTRASEAWSRKERELQQALEGSQAQLAEAVRAREAATQPAAQPAARQPGTYTLDELEQDAAFSPLVKKIKEAEARVEAHEKRLKEHEDYVLRREYTGQLSNLGNRYNTRFNADGKGKAWDQRAFLDYAIQRNISDLDVAYNAYTRDDEIGLASREAEQRGIEKGREAARVPAVPFGRRRPAPRPKDMPEDFQSVTEDQIANDPEIQEAMAKDAGE